MSQSLERASSPHAAGRDVERIQAPHRPRALCRAQENLQRLKPLRRKNAQPKPHTAAAGPRTCPLVA